MNIVWFKRDLRLADHQPLAEAIALEDPVLLLYIIEPALLRNPHYRGRHWHFITQSLIDINKSLAALGTEIHILEGEPEKQLQALHRDTPIKKLLSYEETGLEVTFDRDLRVGKWCREQGIDWREFQTNGVERGRQNRKGLVLYSLWAYSVSCHCFYVKRTPSLVCKIFGSKLERNGSSYMVVSTT